MVVWDIIQQIRDMKVWGKGGLVVWHYERPLYNMLYSPLSSLFLHFNPDDIFFSKIYFGINAIKPPKLDISNHPIQTYQTIILRYYDALKPNNQTLQFRSKPNNSQPKTSQL